MWPFFLERSGGRVTSLPQRDNELPKRWKVTLPRLELKGVGGGVQASGGAADGGTDLIHIKWSGDGHRSVSSCAGRHSSTKRWREIFLVSVSHLLIHPGGLCLAALRVTPSRHSQKGNQEKKADLSAPRPFQTPLEASTDPMLLEGNCSQKEKKKNAFPLWRLHLFWDI